MRTSGISCCCAAGVPHRLCSSCGGGSGAADFLHTHLPPPPSRCTATTHLWCTAAPWAAPTLMIARAQRCAPSRQIPSRARRATASSRTGGGVHACICACNRAIRPSANCSGGTELRGKRLHPGVVHCAAQAGLCCVTTSSYRRCLAVPAGCPTSQPAWCQCWRSFATSTFLQQQTMCLDYEHMGLQPSNGSSSSDPKTQVVQLASSCVVD